MDDTTKARSKVLIDNRNTMLASQSFAESLRRKRPEKKRSQKPDCLAGFAQTIYCGFCLGRKGAHHDKNYLCIVTSITLDRRILTTKGFGKERCAFGHDSLSIHGRQVSLVAEVGIRRSTEYGYSLIKGGYGLETLVEWIE